MKQKLIIAFLMLISINSFAQQDKVKLYKDVFKASEILGAGKKFAPIHVQPKYKTDLFSPPVAVGTLYELIGKEYTKLYFAETKNLLNMALDEPLPVLDSINFEFYRAYAFKYVLDLDTRFKTGSEYFDKYVTFKTAFKDAKTNAERRQLLYNDDNALFLAALEESKYTTFMPAIPVSLTTKIIDNLKFGVTATIVAQLKKETNGKIDITTENALKDSIYKYVEVKNCTYNEIRLRDEYLTKAGKILKGFATNRTLLKTHDDDFSYRLDKYFDNPCAAVVTGAAVFGAKFDFTKFTKLTTSIGAVLKANLGLSDDEKNKISGEVTAQFTKEKTRDLKVNTAQTYYYVKYAFSKDLELGAANCN